MGSCGGKVVVVLSVLAGRRRGRSPEWPAIGRGLTGLGSLPAAGTVPAGLSARRRADSGNELQLVSDRPRCLSDGHRRHRGHQPVEARRTGGGAATGTTVPRRSSSRRCGSCNWESSLPDGPSARFAGEVERRERPDSSSARPRRRVGTATGGVGRGRLQSYSALHAQQRRVTLGRDWPAAGSKERNPTGSVVRAGAGGPVASIAASM